MSEINAQNTATETEAKNFYEWLEMNKAGYDNFMASMYNDSPFPSLIKDDAVAKFKIVNRALKDTICNGHGLMFSSAILWEKVKPTLTPEQIEQFKKADLKMVSGRDILDMIAGIAGKDEAERQTESVIKQCKRHEQHENTPTDAAHDVPTCPASDPKDYCV